MSLNFKTGFMIAVFFNVFLFAMQVGVCEINPDSCPEFYTYEGSSLQKFDQGNFTLSQDLNNELSFEQSTPTEGTTIFTNPFRQLGNWFLSTTLGRYSNLFAFTIPNTLKTLGLPSQISFAIGSIWYMFAIITILLIIFGRN